MYASRQGYCFQLLLAAFAPAMFFLGVDECQMNEEGLRVYVVDQGGVPVQDLYVRIEERGKRTSSVEMEVQADGSFSYSVVDPDATILFFVDHPAYHTGVGLLEPLSSYPAGTAPSSVTITLIPSHVCLDISAECPASQMPGRPGVDYASGELIVNVNDWFSDTEFLEILSPYCLEAEVSPSVNDFSMWTDLLEGDPSDVIEILEASELVQWADVRGYSGAYQGTPILIEFNLSATVNDAQDLIDSVDGLQWLSTSLAPTWGTVYVDKGLELEWMCTLDQDPNVESTELNSAFTL